MTSHDIFNIQVSLDKCLRHFVNPEPIKDVVCPLCHRHNNKVVLLVDGGGAPVYLIKHIITHYSQHVHLLVEQLLLARWLTMLLTMVYTYIQFLIVAWIKPDHYNPTMRSCDLACEYQPSVKYIIRLEV